MIAMGGDGMPGAASTPAAVSDHPLIQACQRPEALSLVAQEDQKLVGVMICGVKAAITHVQHLVVDPAFKEQGVERALVDKVLFKMRSRGIHTLQMPAHIQEACQFLEYAKWEGHSDLHGQIPMGRSPACSLV